MKIIILDNFLNYNYRNVSRFYIRWINFHRDIRLKSIIRTLQKKHGKNLEIKIFSNRTEHFHLDGNIQTISLSDIRIDIDTEEFSKIKKKVIDNVKMTIIKIFDDLRTSKNFYLEGVFLGKLIEYELASFLKRIFGELEILKKILESEYFDKGILFNFNLMFLPFAKKLNTKFGRNLELINDFTLKQAKSLSFWFFAKYFLSLIGFSIKKYFQNKSKLTGVLQKKLQNILFVINTKNQFESIRQIYEFYSKGKKYSAILYHNKYIMPLKEIINLLRFSFQIRNIWLKTINNLKLKLRYDSLKIQKLLEDFYSFKMYFSSIKAFNSLTNFKKILGTYSPVLVMLADELQSEPRLYAKYCKIKKIPTIYVPHAGIPDFPDLTEKSDFKYITVPGELDKKYLIGEGVQSENIFITGRSRYDKFYKGEIKRVNEIKDHFNGHVYKFDPSKYTILYATSKVGMKSSNEFDRGVLLALKELNLLDNLVIKIHPYENGRRHKWVLEELKIEGPVIVKDYDILELIKSSHLFLSRSSFSILEAMIIGTPVIVLDYINVDFYFSGSYKFLEEKDLITVRNQKSLSEVIKKLVNDVDDYNQYSQKIKQLAKGYSYYDGNKTPTERIVSLIKKIV